MSAFKNKKKSPCNGTATKLYYVINLLVLLLVSGSQMNFPRLSSFFPHSSGWKSISPEILHILLP